MNPTDLLYLYVNGDVSYEELVEINLRNNLLIAYHADLIGSGAIETMS